MEGGEESEKGEESRMEREREDRSEKGKLKIKKKGEKGGGWSEREEEEGRRFEKQGLISEIYCLVCLRMQQIRSLRHTSDDLSIVR